MTNEIITTLHPENNENINLYPNIKKKNIPDRSIDENKLDLSYINKINDRFNDVNNRIDDMSDGSPRYVNTSSNILSLTTNQGLAVSTDTGHWYYWDGTKYVDGGLYQSTGIADNSIDINKIEFKTNSSNLFNKYDLDMGHYYYYKNNNYNSQPDFCATSLIPILPNNTILFSTPIQHICFYDENETFIGNPYWSAPIANVKAPSNAQYIRVSIPISIIDTFQMSVDILGEYKNGLVIKKEFVENPYIEVEYGKVNHFNNKTTTDGYWIYYENGAIAPLSTFFYSDYIDVSEMSDLTIVNSSNPPLHICFYDENKTFISGVLGTYINILPNNAKYIRFSGLISDKSNLMVVDGNYEGQILNYIDYKAINRNLIPIIISNDDFIKRCKIEINSTDNNTTFVSKMSQAYQMGNCDVYINGIWDFSSVTDISNIDPNGLKIGKNNRYYFTSKSKIICNYTGNDSDIQSLFSLFYNYADYGSFEIYNLNIECANIRYCIHDECGDETQTTPYTHKYINCNMKLDNSNSPYKDNFQHCIGGGLGYNAEIIIDKCYFNSVYTQYGDVQYHGNWANNDLTHNGHSKLFVTNSYFEHTMAISSPDYETEKKYLLFANNSCESDLLYHNTSSNYWDVKKWGNNIRL